MIDKSSEKEIKVCEYLSEIMHIPVCICNKNGQIEKDFQILLKEWKRIYRNPECINRFIKLKKADYPVIIVDENGFVFSIIGSSINENTIIVGPAVISRSDEELIAFLCEKYQVKKQYKKKWPVYTDREYISGIILLFEMITGKEISKEEIQEHNKKNYEKVSSIKKSICQKFFSRQEDARKHNPYEQEMRELESIENGNEEALKKSMSEVYDGKIGILAKNPLRHHQNVAIGNVTLASRAAIRGGVEVEKSFSMADLFIKQIEEMTTISEVEEYKRELKIIYAQTVKEENEKGIEDRNPLIREVKNYIFTHLHDAIKVSEVAECFNVNPDYLSHLFSRHEKMTFRQYVLNEKIKRSKNLLKYSDYKIQEIGFYLGFSSQSHFTKVFKDITGIKPSEYRKKYGNCSEWKSEK